MSSPSQATLPDVEGAAQTLPLDELPQKQAPAEASQKPAPPVPPTAEATVRHRAPSFSDIWQSTHHPPRRDTRLPYAIGVAATLVAGLALIVQIVPTQPQSWDIDRLMAEQTAAQAKAEDDWISDLQEVKHRPSLWAPLIAAAQQQSPPPDKPAAPRAKSARRGVASTTPAAAAPTKSVPSDAPDPLYAQMYGSASRIKASSSRAAAIAPPASAHQQKAINVRGAEVPARLLDEISSSPAGAPVKAVTIGPAKVGDIALPQQTELEGVVSGGSDTRVFVAFDLARLPDGRTIAIDGLARDRLKGGLGIPGRKNISSRTVESVGVSAAGRAISAAGRVLGGGVGEIAGAGIEGATDSVSEKSHRLDRDEEVVTANQGAPFRVYIRAIEPAAS